MKRTSARERVGARSPSRGGRCGSVLLALVPLSFALASCSPVYVLRAGYEELRILCRRQPIEQVLQGNVTPETRAKLQLTLAVRKFARDDLGLTVGGSYASLAQVDANQIVWVVTAAPWDRLEAYTWWFPIVGRVPYRGYFDRADAECLAAEMEREGYDTYVRPSVAFSTLGWFDDPLLSNLLRYEPAALADVIIHELLHNTIYLAGHTAFNETFANFVGGRGAISFFEKQGETGLADRARARFADTLTFAHFLDGLVTRLEEAYASGIDRDRRAKLFEKAQAEFRALPWRTDEYRRFGEAPLNNARIVAQWIYVKRLDLFEDAYRACDEDLATTIERIRGVCADADDPFAALEKAFAVRARVPRVDAGRAAATRS